MVTRSGAQMCPDVRNDTGHGSPRQGIALPESRRVATRGLLLALAAIVLLAFTAYSLLGRSVESPVFKDESRYVIVADSIAAGEGLMLRGDPYRFPPLYPLVLAPILRIAPDRATAYELAKVLNALLFALAAVPIFLLARRLLQPWPSVLVAALSVAIPSGMYVSLVMAESLAFFLASWAFLAIALALERPTIARQVLALVAIGMACAARPQFLALYVAYVMALLVVMLVERRARPLSAPSWTSLWPTGFWLLAVLALGIGDVLRSGASQLAVIGGYSAVWGTHPPRQLVRAFLAELAELDLYLGVVPFVVAPVVLLALWRSQSRRHPAFAALFVASNLTLLMLVAAVDIAWTEAIQPGFELVHDRYTFYLVPLWLIVLASWLTSGAPRPRGAFSIGAGFAVALPLFLILPEGGGRLQHLNATASTLWTGVESGLTGIPLVSGGAALLFALAVVLATVLVPARHGLALAVLVLAVFLVSGEVTWYLARTEASSYAQTVPRGEWEWVDEGVDAGSVTLLVGSGRCDESEWPNSYSVTEFFNRSVKTVVQLSALPGLSAWRPGSNEPLRLPTGELLSSKYVVAPHGFVLEGRRMREGTRDRLVLWQVDGAVRLRAMPSSRSC